MAVRFLRSVSFSVLVFPSVSGIFSFYTLFLFLFWSLCNPITLNRALLRSGEVPDVIGDEEIRETQFDANGTQMSGGKGVGGQRRGCWLCRRKGDGTGAPATPSEGWRSVWSWQKRESYQNHCCTSLERSVNREQLRECAMASPEVLWSLGTRSHELAQGSTLLLDIPAMLQRQTGKTCRTCSTLQ